MSIAPSASRLTLSGPIVVVCILRAYPWRTSHNGAPPGASMRA
jgi:hypothetical protein